MIYYLIVLCRELVLLANAPNRQVTRSQYKLLSFVLVDLGVPKIYDQISKFIEDASNDTLLIHVEDTLQELRADPKLSESQRRKFDIIENQIRFGVVSLLKAAGFFQHRLTESTWILTLTTTVPEPFTNRKRKRETNDSDSDASLQRIKSSDSD